MASTVTHIATCPICGSSFISQRRTSAPSGEIKSYYLVCATCGHKTETVSTFTQLDTMVKWAALSAKNA